MANLLVITLFRTQETKYVRFLLPPGSQRLRFLVLKHLQDTILKQKSREKSIRSNFIEKMTKYNVMESDQRNFIKLHHSNQTL